MIDLLQYKIMEINDVDSTNNQFDIYSLTTSDAKFIKLPLWRKLTFSVGGIPMQLVQNVLSFFLPIYLLETAKLIPYYLSIVQIISRCVDAVTDPIVGYLVLRTKKTKLGRKRPWILFAIPICLLTSFFIFYTVKFSSMEAKLAYYVIVLVFLQIGFTCYSVPYSSMTMVLSDEPRERDTLTAYRMFSETFSILLGVAIFGAIIGPNRETNTCGTDTSGKNSSSSLNAENSVQKTAEINAYMLGAGVISLMILISSLVCFFGTKEVNSCEEVMPKYLSSVKAILTNKPYLLLMGAFLQYSLALQFIQGNISLYITHSLNMSNMTVPGLMTILGTAVLLLPLAQLCIRKLGKKTTMTIGMLFIFPLLLALMFIPPNLPLWAFFPLFVWASVTLAIGMLTPWSMLPDVIDAFYLEQDTRQEALFYSFIVFFNKLAVGLSLAISAGVLGYVGYNTESCVQPESVGTALRYLCGPTPLFMFLPGLVFLYFYPLNEKKILENRELLNKKLQVEIRETSDDIDSFKI